jgi:hypothetical protein
MAYKTKQLVQNFWRDKKGDIVLWQTPNIELISWILLSVVGSFIKNSRLKNLIDFAATVMLLIWAFLEIIQGVNYFRRLLGITIIGFIIYSRS